MDNDTLAAFSLLAALGVPFLFIWFLPAIVAYRRHVEARGLLLLVLVVVGLTGLGWLGCLLWAALGVVEVPREARCPARAQYEPHFGRRT